jgi:hypothetical protein
MQVGHASSPFYSVGATSVHHIIIFRINLHRWRDAIVVAASAPNQSSLNSYLLNLLPQGPIDLHSYIENPQLP